LAGRDSGLETQPDTDVGSCRSTNQASK